MGYLVGIALIVIGIGQAFTRGFVIDGWFLLLSGLGLFILALAHITHSDPPHEKPRDLPLEQPTQKEH